jgi:putative peptidoglycan lipid II flippase
MFRAAAKLFSGSVLGKFVGLFREVLLAALFGTTAPVGAIRIAQTATLIPAHFITTDSLAAVFLPLYKRLAKEDADNAQALFWSVGAVLLGLSIVIMLVLFWLAPAWVGVLAPGFSPSEQAMAASFVTVMALALPLYIAGSLFAYLDMGHGSYLLASMRTSIQSLGLIGGTLTAYWFGRPVLLAWGFTAAYTAFAIWGLARTGKRGELQPRWAMMREKAPAVLRDFWQTWRPLMVLPVLLQGNIALERIVASLIGSQVVPALDYARFITETGVVLLATPLGLAGLSELSGLSTTETRDRITRVLRPMLILSVPVSAFLALHSKPVIDILYQRGAFGEESADVTQSILFGLSLGFWGHMAGYVLLKALNAQLRNREVFWFMATALGLNAAINVSMYQTWGPVTLGIGSSVFGLTLFVTGVLAVGVGRAVWATVGWLAIGVMLYVPLSPLVPAAPLLVMPALFFLLYWGAFVLIVPPLRRAILPLLNKLARAAP